MKKRRLRNVIYDSILCSAIVHLMLDFSVSIYSSKFSLFQHLVIACIATILTTTLFLLFMQKEKNVKDCLAFFALDLLYLALFSIIWLLFPIRLLPIREDTPGDYFVIFFVAGFYILVSTFLRIGILAIVCILKKQSSTEDGSACYTETQQDDKTLLSSPDVKEHDQE